MVQLSDRIAYTVVTEFFPKADYYVDLHCGDGFEGLVSYVYCTGAAAPEVAAKSREMAEIAHVDYLVTSSVWNRRSLQLCRKHGNPKYPAGTWTQFPLVRRSGSGGCS